MVGRPIIYNNLKITSVLIEADMVNQAKAMGINISDVCRQAIESMVGNPKTKELYFKFIKIPTFEMRKVRRFVVENSDRSEFWAKWLNQKYGAELIAQDIIDKLDLG